MVADTVFVVNPVAGGGRTRRRWPAYERFLRRTLEGSIEARLTQGPGQATHLAQEAVQNGATTIVSVGGDGTLNEVVNGMVDGTGRPWASEARLGILSLGTGADFAKTFDLPTEPGAFASLLTSGETRPLDLGRCEFIHAGAPHSRYFLNVAEFGSGGAVVERVNRTTKILGGKMSFLLAILRTLPKYVNTRIGYLADGGPRTQTVVNDFVVANGRFFGGGLKPAPHADPEDGLFDVVVIGDIDFKTARKNLDALRAGTHLGLPDITFFRARELVIEAHGEMIDLDGEFVGRYPRRFVNLPARLPVVVGSKGG